MKVAIDITPLDSSNPHAVRGSGFYIKHLKDSLEEVQKSEEITYFTRGQKLPTDVDLIHYPYFEPFFLTLPSKKIGKNIVTVHDLTPIKFKKDFPSGIKGSIKWLLQKKRLSQADAIITDSFSSKNDIVHYLKYPEKNVRVIPLAAAPHFKLLPNEKVIEAKKKYMLPEKFVLYVGDVTPNKNLPRLAKAIKKINIPFILVGKAIASKNYDRFNPWNRDLVELQEIISNNPDTMRSIGYVTDNDLVGIYNAASVFVMPSLYEGFGLPVIEAMSCGTPVVTSAEGSLAEVAADAAVYVDPTSVSDMAENIQKVYNDDLLRADMRDKGLERSIKFTWEKTANLTLSAYRSLF